MPRVRFDLTAPRRIARPALFAALSLAGFLLQGCGVYFNTFFNAEKAHRKAMDLRAKRLALNPEDTVTVAADERVLLNRAVAKSSRVLELWPDHATYAPRAVFLIAESQSLMGDYGSATLKYEEYLRYFPNSERIPLARVRYAHALYLDGKRLAAQDALEEVLKSDLRGETRREALLLSARMRIDEQSGAEGLALYEQLLAEGAFPGPEARNEAHWNAALLAYDLREWEKARTHARAGDPGILPFRIRFRNHRLAILALLHLGRHAEALAEIRELQGRREFRPFRPDLKVLEARTLEAAGDWPGALDLYRETVKLSPRSAPAAEAWYRIGARVMDVENREDTARAYFDSAVAAGRGFEYGEKAVEVSDALRSLAELRAPDTTGADSARPHYRSFMIAELFHFRLPRPDSARVHLHRIVSDTLEDTAYTRRAFYALAWIETNAFAEAGGRVRADSLHETILVRWPGTEWAKQAEMNLGRPSTVQTEVDKAHVLFLEAEKRHLAGENLAGRVVPAYRAVVQTHPGTPDAARAQFVLAFLTKEQALTLPRPVDPSVVDSVKAAYEAVREHYPGTPYAEAAEPWIYALESAGGEDGGQDPRRSDAPPDDDFEDTGDESGGKHQEHLDSAGELDLY